MDRQMLPITLSPCFAKAMWLDNKVEICHLHLLKQMWPIVFSIKWSVSLKGKEEEEK